MDSTQRGVLGGFGGVLVLAGIGWPALFVHSHPIVRVAPAVAMAVIGLVMVLVAMRGTRKEAATPPVVPPRMTAEERRTAVYGQLVDARAAGEKIARFPTIERTLTEAPPWQDAVYDLLESTLDDPMPAQMFAMMSTPVPGQPEHAGLGHRISKQVTYLSEILKNFAMYQIKESWQP